MDKMEQTKKPNYGRRNKTKGSNAERLYAKIFRSLGFDFCKTSREASRLYDDSAIDLVNIPYLIQIKAGKQAGMNPSNILSYMEERVKSSFPPDSKEHTLPKIVIHHKDVRNKSMGRTQFDTIVYMTFETFIKLQDLQYVTQDATDID